MFKVKALLKTLALGLVAAGSLTAAQAFADCTPQQEAAFGRKISETVKSQLSDQAPHQDKRMIKVYDCAVSDGVITASFTYNYIFDRKAYAVDGQGSLDTTGKIEVAQLDAPSVVFASIDTQYME